MEKITQKIIEPNLLIALHQLGGSAPKLDAIDRVADNLKLTEEQKDEVNSNGNNVLYYCTGWARQSLKLVGLLKDTSPRGLWELSKEGQNLIPELLKNTQEENEKIVQKMVKTYRKGSKQEFFNNEQQSELILEEENDQKINPLEYLQQLDPFKFERLCAKIFKSMNFENVEYTQSTNDKGIDGHGDLVFGLVKFKVVFQAKRYAEGNTVGAPEIQKLAGAMQEDGAEKAVFITTSRYSSQAKQTAKKLKIELIDGTKLIKILQEKRIGFIERIEHEINLEFFEEL